MEERDSRGRFLPGNSLSKRRPGEVAYQHPRFPGRDSRGHWTNGHEQLYYPAHVQRIKVALLSAVTEADVAGAGRELLRLARPGEHGPTVQLQAIDLLLSYVLGKPTLPVAALPRQEKPALDLGRLTDEELGQLARLLDKARNAP
jgi:hypothetical protein